MTDPFRLAFDVWAAARAPLGRHLPVVDIEATEELLADRNGAATPRIMIFGTYNAGKSTLINALVGAEVAPVADHPKTDRVTSYAWHGFLLDDTPGLDAPIEHEQVARKHLDASDVVLFVIATDGTLEEQRTANEIIDIVKIGKPIRVIVNNKGGFRPDSEDFLSLRDRLAENLRRAAVAARIEDIETRAPIRLVNAASGLRGRMESKSVLLANSGLLDLEADITDLCETTGKGQIARTVCQRIAKQIDLALASLSTDEAMHPIREAIAAIAAERSRLAAVLDHATQEAATHFQADLTNAVLSREPRPCPNASKEAADAVTVIIERELRTTQRVIGNVESAVVGQAVDIPTVSAPGIPLPEGPTAPSGGFGFNDAAKFFAPALKQLDHDTLVGGLEAAKKVFPKIFDGLGKETFKKIVPFIGPAIQGVMGISEAYAAHRDSQREFERERDHRVALQQQVTDAGRQMRWALNQQCQGLIESIFGPVEESFARQFAMLKGQAALLEADRTVLAKCKGRLDIELAV